ncbi:hypothetical protein [Zobellia laminariae]|uniref:hypothetical protein n=1 Tax=Zobellia laminariae TaxID=248906 RepID=UPI004056CFAB
MNIPKKYLFSITVLSVAFFFVVITIIKQKKNKNEINSNLHETVAMVTGLRDNRNITIVEYKYVYDNKIYNSDEFADIEVTKAIVNKYYKVYLSTKDPSKSLIQLEKEVSDTNRIKAAGFDLRITN